MILKIAFASVALSMLVLSTFSRAQDSPSTTAPASHQESLQGTWKGVEVGREAEGKATLTISGNTIHFQGAKKKEWYKATFSLPAGTNPKSFEGGADSRTFHFTKAEAEKKKALPADAK